MLIIVSGFAGSGKSTLADALGKKFKLKVVHASHLLKELQNKTIKEIDIENTKGATGFWETTQGKKFLEKREKDFSLDKKLDKLLLKLAEKENIVLDSWTMPWLCKKGIKIWLETSAKQRAKRVASRDNLKEKDALKKILERDKKTAMLYKKNYGFIIGKDFTPFDLIISTDKLNEKQVTRMAVSKIKKIRLKKLTN